MPQASRKGILFVATERARTNSSSIEELNDLAIAGVGAETLLRAMEPLMERRLAQLIEQFAICPPELGLLLDFRAKISELWRIRKELNNARRIGSQAKDALEAIISAHSERSEKERPQ